MEKSILKLGQMVTDNVTGIKGMLTMYSEDMDNNVLYLFQPSKLNPETKEPVDRYWLSKSRVDAEDYKVELPLHILGTVVEDKATGFKGASSLPSPLPLLKNNAVCWASNLSNS